mgnify:CR=1 FL=1
MAEATIAGMMGAPTAPGSEAYPDNDRELLDWCNTWFRTASDWRKQSFEGDWRTWQRNADSIYDPALKARKESWMSTAFISLTATHRETIKAQLFRTAMGPRPIIEMKPRSILTGPADQAPNIRDLIARDMEKTQFELEYDRVLDDVTTYGSGFARVYHETRIERRLVRQPQVAPVAPDDPAIVSGELPPQPRLAGWSQELAEVITFRGTRFEALSIWDIFPDPKALGVKGSPIAYRFRETYDDVVRKVEAGFYNPDALTRLRREETSETEPDDKLAVESDRGIADMAPRRTDYGRVFEFKEFFCKVPQKWILPPEAIHGDPETLLAARIIFHQDCVLAKEPSSEYDAEPPILKADYMPVNQRFYARGIPEMLKDMQALVNETVNQRIDNVALVMNKMFAVIEAAVVDAKDFTSSPGGCVRLKGNKVTDVRQALQVIDMPDVTQSSYREVIEYERYSQERTSANRVTIGTAGQVRDANQTLGGMEILRQTANEKFAYIGMLQEFGFLMSVARQFWQTIYSNLTPEDVIAALGEERAQTFVLLSPEQVEADYFYSPQGIFTMENKAMRQARLSSIDQEFAGEPWLNRMAVFDRIVQSADEDPRSLKHSPDDMQRMMMAAADMRTAASGPKDMPALPPTNGGPRGPVLGPNGRPARAEAAR